ncbi:MAG TPA: VOC family protein [Rhodospirillales bacterium]|nr:VOC family protein [Rhodospirillales bacterium]
MGGAAKRRTLGGAALLLGLGVAACVSPAPASADSRAVQEAAVANPVHYVEMPVTDIERAVRFYTAVFGFALTRQTVDGYEMALFPRTWGAPGASGALASGDVYVPSKSGPVVYFDVADIDAVLERAEAQGAAILYAKKRVGAGYVAEIEDSEGNRIALHALAD